MDDLSPQFHFVLASDSLKGTLSSAEAEGLLEAAAHAHFPNATCACVPMADGGEGTVDAVVAAMGGEMRSVRVHDPLGRPVEARYGLLGSGRAIIEMAAASGLTLLGPDERNPLRASTYGTGELISDALMQGCTDVSLAVGGSATNDGGMGCMRALGARFLDEQGSELMGSGADLAHVRAIDVGLLRRYVAGAHFTVMCDVDNPLVGELGATRVFAPQKGATPQQVEELERGMARYAEVLRSTFRMGVDAGAPGSGAAGGLGLACVTFLGARAQGGIDRVLDLVAFGRRLRGASLCITGEGRLDAQTSHGKVVSGVAAACQRRGVPCVALVGVAEPNVSIAGVSAVIAVTEAPELLDAASMQARLAHAHRLYAHRANQLFAALSLGRSLEARSR